MSKIEDLPLEIRNKASECFDSRQTVTLTFMASANDVSKGFGFQLVLPGLTGFGWYTFQSSDDTGAVKSYIGEALDNMELRKSHPRWRLSPGSTSIDFDKKGFMDGKTAEDRTLNNAWLSLCQWVVLSIPPHVPKSQWLQAWVYLLNKVCKQRDRRESYYLPFDTA
jgi:hypothetical protein